MRFLQARSHLQWLLNYQTLQTELFTGVNYWKIHFIIKTVQVCYTRRCSKFTTVKSSITLIVRPTASLLQLPGPAQLDNKDKQSICNNVQDKQGFCGHFIAPFFRIQVACSQKSFRKLILKNVHFSLSKLLSVL